MFRMAIRALLALTHLPMGSASAALRRSGSGHRIRGCQEYHAPRWGLQDESV